MAQPQLTGAIIGAGFFGGIQAEAWSRLPQANIIAVADPDQDRAAAFAESWGIPRVFPDAKSLIREQQPDFVDIATRPDTHLELTNLALGLNCHVICQKPMAPTLSECQQMVEHSQRAGKRLLIHENWRWQPWYRAAKQAIEVADLGEIFHLRFHVRTGDGFGPGAYTVQPYFSEMKRFLIYETLIHHLDTARFVAGEVRSLVCQTQRVNSKISGEDSVLISLQFESNASGVIDANRLNGENPAPKVFGLMTVECQRGAVRIDNSGRVWTRDYATGEESEFAYEWRDQGYRGDSVFAVQEHMANCLINHSLCESEGENYLKSVQLVEACYRSAEENRVVKVNS